MEIKTLVVRDTGHIREYWEGKGLARDHLGQAQSADVLIVPFENIREGVDFAFPQGTGDLYKSLKGLGPNVLSVEILAEDDEYLEFVFHAAARKVGVLIVKYGVAPLLINLLANHISDELRAKPDDYVELTIVVEKHDCTGVQFDYRGRVDGLHVLADSVGELVQKCTDQSVGSQHIEK